MDYYTYLLKLLYYLHDVFQNLYSDNESNVSLTDINFFFRIWTKLQKYQM